MFLTLAALLADDLKLRDPRAAGPRGPQPQAGAGDAADLTRGELLALLEQPAYLGDPGLAGEFLDYVDQRAGLLVGQGGDETGRAARPTAFRTAPSRSTWPAADGQGAARRASIGERAGEGDAWYLAALLGRGGAALQPPRPEEAARPGLRALPRGAGPASAPGGRRSGRARWRRCWGLTSAAGRRAARWRRGLPGARAAAGGCCGRRPCRRSSAPRPGRRWPCWATRGRACWTPRRDARHPVVPRAAGSVHYGQW